MPARVARRVRERWSDVTMSVFVRLYHLHDYLTNIGHASKIDCIHTLGGGFLMQDAFEEGEKEVGGYQESSST